MKRWALAVLLAMTASLMLPAGAQAAAPKCGDVLFVGAAGSGESGMGAEVTAVHRALKAKATGRTVTSYALPYRAADVKVLGRPGNGIAKYMESLIGGEALLNTFLFDRVRQCPGERLVLAGYSQGAMVIHRSLQILGAAVTDRVDAVVLVGDGDRLPNDDAQSSGSAGAKAKGIGQWYPAFSQANGRKLGSAVGGRVLSVCNRLDIVCDHVPAFHLSTNVGLLVGASVHTSYLNGSLLTAAAAKAAAKLRKDALTVYRPSGRAGFVSFASGFSCPAVADGYVLVVARGAGQAASEVFADPYDGPVGEARVGTSAGVAPGSYQATVTCEASTDPNVRTGGKVLKTYGFTQTVNAAAPMLGVSPPAAKPGVTLVVSDGGGCGAYPAEPQTADVVVFDAIRGGKPVVETTAAVTSNGRWGPVSMVLPAGSGVAGWHVTATCAATASETPDQSYQPYPTVTVAAG
jgi:hypothetical protein